MPTSRFVAGLISLAGMMSAGMSVQAAEPVRVGVLLPQTGVGAILAKQMQAAIELALTHGDGKLGGQAVDISWGDTQGKVDVAKQLAEEMVKSKKVDFLIGPVFSSEMMAVQGGLAKSDTFLISPIAGPAPIAGKGCSANFFNVSSQNDQQAEAMGEYLQRAGVKRVYAMTVNNQAGKDMVSGLKRYYKGELVGEVYTRFGQVDFAAELSTLRTTAPEATFIFYPGDMGIQYVRQYAQAGLIKTSPLYTVWTVDQASLPAIGDDAISVKSANVWSVDLKNSVNQRFVSDFKKANGYLPNDYAAHAYDSVRLIDSAVATVKGDMSSKAAIRSALETAKFESDRGPFSYNANHFPIQDYYIRQVAKDSSGTLVTETVETIMRAQKDAYFSECKLSG